MKLLVIYGQTHKKNTYCVTQKYLHRLKNLWDEKKLEEGIEIEKVFLQQIPQCVGCTQCILKNEEKCPHREKMRPLEQKVDWADVLVVASPNYCMNMTGQMKSFFDHYAYRWMSHRPVDMRRKTGIAIATTAGTGAKKVTKSIKEQLIWWSVGRVCQIPFTVSAFTMEEVSEKRMKKLDKVINRAAKNTMKNYFHTHICFQTKFFFGMMKKMHKDMQWNEVETKYWKEKGWI